MVLPLLGGIFATVSAVAELFDTGKQVYETVTGEKATASSAPELRQQIEALRPDQQAAWAEAMQVSIQRYRAETDRLRIEQGTLEAGVLATLDEETRARVADLRMTTRPLIVRRSFHVVALPFYVAIADTLTGLVEAGGQAVGYAMPALPKIGPAVFEGPMLEAYTTASVSCTAFVSGYMLLREIGKAREGGQSSRVAGAISNLVGGVKSIIGR